jgi:ATPase subunit of ABC transporter with duplicated ATPase domains
VCVRVDPYGFNVKYGFHSLSLIFVANLYPFLLWCRSLQSTLLKILAEHACRRNAAAASGAATARDLGFQYTGQVTIPRNVRVAYVEQEPYTSSHVTVADALLGIRSAAADGKNADTDKNSSGGDVYSAVHAYRRAADRAESDPQAFAAACAEMDAHSGSWNVWTKMEEVATKLRIRHLQDQPLSKLSGGERKRGNV